MIPKVLHYCWFGKAPFDETTKKCIASWEKYCPDYKIIQWNESNFDIKQNTFVYEAYQNKKWAFVSDYVRLYVLYHYGGIYLDADVELIKNLDDLLALGDVVTGYQEEVMICTAFMMAKEGNPWIEKLLSYYDDRHFVKPDGSFDMTTNSTIITMQSAQECGFHIGDHTIKLGNVCLLDSVYFSPYKTRRKLFKKGEDTFRIDQKRTYAIHHGVGSWAHDSMTYYFKALIPCLARSILPEKTYARIKGKIYRKKMGI